MVDLPVATSTSERRDSPAPRRWAPWLAFSLAVAGLASYAGSMALPYYVNDLDRFPLEDVPWGLGFDELWPYDTAYSLPFGLAGMYAVMCAPFVAVGVVVWAGFRLWTEWGAATWLAHTITLMAAAVSIATLGWLGSPLGSTLVTWWLD